MDSEESLIAFRDTELARTIPSVYQATEPPRSDLADVCLIVRPAERQASATD